MQRYGRRSRDIIQKEVRNNGEDQISRKRKNTENTGISVSFVIIPISTEIIFHCNPPISEIQSIILSTN